MQIFKEFLSLDVEEFNQQNKRVVETKSIYRHNQDKIPMMAISLKRKTHGMGEGHSSVIGSPDSIPFYCSFHYYYFCFLYSVYIQYDTFQNEGEGRSPPRVLTACPWPADFFDCPFPYATVKSDVVSDIKDTWRCFGLRRDKACFLWFVLKS